MSGTRAISCGYCIYIYATNRGGKYRGVTATATGYSGRAGPCKCCGRLGGGESRYYHIINDPPISIGGLIIISKFHIRLA